MTEGIIVKGIGGFYYVETAEGVYECKARGVFRKEKITPLVGDRVKISINEAEKSENTIEEILPRSSFLLRPPVANIDQLIIVVSGCQPSPNTVLTDRLTAIAINRNIEPIIVLNKSDLIDVLDLYKAYSTTGFRTIVASGRTGYGVDEIKALLEGKISAFTGNSGVGKSTLLNCIDPSLGLATSEISLKLGRGKHTTRETTLHKICGGYVADTPGFASLEILKNEIILKDELQYCFPEFEDYIEQCKFFPSCAHINDSGCAVRKAVEDGQISGSRYQSYRVLYDEVKDLKEWELKNK
ncbi:MAG: ribosome small subunit-dependent GTPase A [Oscillospiraceae bacterium]|nr:ribosome small subunit-dependent GTPase A [Oscillospiraceae bacterium]